MSIISNLLGSGIIGEIKGVIGQFHLAPEKEQEFLYKMQELLQRRDSELEQTARAELDAQKSIITAELSQDDKYTKRARPTVIYAGLAFIFLNHVLFPMLMSLTGHSLPRLDLPPEFWWAWGGIVCTYAVGRTMEKRGVDMPLVRSIVGRKN